MQIPQSFFTIGFLCTAAMLGLLLHAFPQIDIHASGVFYNKIQGFFLSEHPLLTTMHELATVGSRVLAAALCIMALMATILKQIWGIPRQKWLFVLLMLLIGPGLVANVVLKDNWGRARPREITDFGGTATFSPALIPQPHARANESFVAGDAAFGFFFSSFAAMIPLSMNGQNAKKSRRRSKFLFWLGIAIGGAFGLTRLAMGAHFLSDIIFAMMFMLAVMVILQTLTLGKQLTKHYWRCWLSM